MVNLNQGKRTNKKRKRSCDSKNKITINVAWNIWLKHQRILEIERSLLN